MGATSVQWTSNEHKTVIQPHIKELFCSLINHYLTLFWTELKIYVKWQGGSVCHHHPLLNNQNHCEKPKIFLLFI